MSPKLTGELMLLYGSGEAAVFVFGCVLTGEGAYLPPVDSSG